MKKSRKNYGIYISMLALFGTLIYVALSLESRFTANPAAQAINSIGKSAFEMFGNIIIDNLSRPLTVLLFQIIVILIAVRLFSHLFKYIGQPGVIGEIVAGIVLGPSVLGLFFPESFALLFPTESLGNLELLSQIGLVLFMFVIGMEVDFGILKNKMNETLVISHAGIVVPFFLGIVASYWVYEDYAAGQTAFLPFALFIGISMSITAFPVLARIIQERNMTKTPLGVLVIASAANDDVTAWCLLAIVIAVAKAGTFVSALYTVGLTLLFIGFMFLVIRPFLKKVGQHYANSEVINKSFVGFILLTLIISSVTTEIIGIHALFGAFMAGVVMPVNHGFRKVMMEKVEDVALVFFLPLFFAFTGLRTQIGLINTPELWGVCGLLVSIAILGKLGGCSIAARLVGESWRDSFVIGTLMNTRGLMELVALNIGYEMGILPPEIFVILVIMALVTTFMTTPILSLVEKFFAHKEKQARSEHKIILSFGRPDSGGTLLSIAGNLLGEKLKDTGIIAAHYTLGTDLNPVKARQYAKESFRPLDEEARRLNLRVDKRYRVTDHIIQEIARLSAQEQADLLLVGAGPRFMQDQLPGPISSKINPPAFIRFIHRLKDQSYRLPGNLLKEKLETMTEEVQCNMLIFVNRDYTTADQLFWFIDNESDLDLLETPLVKNIGNGKPIHLCYLAPGSVAPAIQQRISTLAEQQPERYLADLPVSVNSGLCNPGTLLIMSYATCRHLARTNSIFTQLPSLLVLKPKNGSISTTTQH